MSKELEALERMGCATLEEDLSVRDIYENEYEIAEKALQKLEFLNATLNFTDGTIESSFYHNGIKVIAMPYERCEKLEEENAYIEKIKTMMKQKDCVLRYIESDDCFAVKTMLSDGWCKLTPEFVDDNVREEIKPLPLIEKNKQLKEENAEYKKVFEILNNKDVDIELFKKSKSVEDYNFCCVMGRGKRKELTEEEYNSIGEWLNGKSN